MSGHRDNRHVVCGKKTMKLVLETCLSHFLSALKGGAGARVTDENRQDASSLAETLVGAIANASCDLLDKQPFQARFKKRVPDPGTCVINSIDWTKRMVSMSNGSCCYLADFDDIEIV